MGTSTTPGQTDNTDALIPEEGEALLQMSQRVRQLQDAVAITPHESVCVYYQMQKLAKALNRFAANRMCWTRKYPEDRGLLQRHLAFTLFVPAGRADKARKAVEDLWQASILPHISGSDTEGVALVNKITAVTKSLVRFPTQKATRLAQALATWDTLIVPGMLAPFIHRTTAEAQQYIMKLISGYGPKASAHFMRNTGLMSGWDALPIIDTHIMKLIDALGMAHPKYTYDEYAAKFTVLAKIMGVPPLLLDAVIWCSYAQNWDISHSDFDNFGVDHTSQNTGTPT